MKSSFVPSLQWKIHYFHPHICFGYSSLFYQRFRFCYFMRPSTVCLIFFHQFWFYCYSICGVLCYHIFLHCLSNLKFNPFMLKTKVFIQNCWPQMKKHLLLISLSLFGFSIPFRSISLHHALNAPINNKYTVQCGKICCSYHRWIIVISVAWARARTCTEQIIALKIQLNVYQGKSTKLNFIEFWWILVIFKYLNSDDVHQQHNISIVKVHAFQLNYLL